MTDILFWRIRNFPFFFINIVYTGLVVFSLYVSYVNISNITQSGYYISYYIMVVIEQYKILLFLINIVKEGKKVKNNNVNEKES